MVREVPAWHIPHVPAGMAALVGRMGRDADCRAECFSVADDAFSSGPPEFPASAVVAVMVLAPRTTWLLVSA